MTNQHLDISRLNKFVIRQSTLYVNQLLLAVAVIFGLLLTVTLLVAYFNPQELYQIWGFYIGVYFVAGYILSSAAFSELNSPHSGYAFLTLPVSSLEKLIGAWFITSFVYTAVYFLVVVIMYYTVGFIMPNAQLHGIFGEKGEFSMVALQQFGEIVITYIATQSLFLLGASTFTKHNLLKTLLSVFIFLLVIGLYAALVFKIVFAGIVATESGGPFISEETQELLKLLSKVFNYVIFPLFMLTVSYFKLKERQV